MTNLEKSLSGCIERFRSIALVNRSKLPPLEDIVLRCEWSAREDIIPTCEVVQLFKDGKEAVFTKGEGSDACNEAVKSFEEILEKVR